MKYLKKFNESLSEIELVKGIKVESEHGNIYEEIESHLKEIPDYYTRLEKMERE